VQWELQEEARVDARSQAVFEWFVKAALERHRRSVPS
jgi:hypothetical protein